MNINEIALCSGLLVGAWAIAPPSEVQPDPVHETAVSLKAPEYLYLRDVTVLDGHALDMSTGALAKNGHSNQEGVWWAITPLVVSIEGVPSEVPQGAVLGAGFTKNNSRRCSVRCRSGYYACCYVNGDLLPVCRCRRLGLPDDDCQSGGEGSEDCEIEVVVE